MFDFQFRGTIIQHPTSNIQCSMNGMNAIDFLPALESHSPMSRILVAVSSPWAAEKVAEPLAGLAMQLDAEVLVVHVSRPSGGQMREQEQSDGEAAVRLLSDRLASKNIAVQTLLMFSDDIARAVLNTAVERQITLIVLGL